MPSKEGVASKTHRGSSFTKRNEERIFTLDGYLVSYCKIKADGSKGTKTGQFDLRQCKSMEKPAPGSADEGADIKLTMPSKKIAIAFKEDKDEWLKLMCSAVKADSVITSDELKACYNAEVFNTFIDQHAKQRGKTKTVYEKATTSAPPAAAAAPPPLSYTEPAAAPPAAPTPAPESAPAPTPAPESAPVPEPEATIAAPTAEPSGADADANEKNRLEWFNYSIATKDVKMAKELFVSAEEQAMVEQLEADMSGTDAREAPTVPAVPATEEEMEEARGSWLKFHIAAGDYEAAMEMAVTADDYVAISDAEELKRKAWLDWAMSNENPTEAYNFAVTDGEYAAISALESKLKSAPAGSGEVDDDETQEKARLAWMDYHLSVNEFKQAAKYAVTAAEEENIEKASNLYQEKSRQAWMQHYMEKGAALRCGTLPRCRHHQCRRTTHSSASLLCPLPSHLHPKPPRSSHTQASTSSPRISASPTRCSCLTLLAPHPTGALQHKPPRLSASQELEQLATLQEEGRKEWVAYSTAAGDTSAARDFAVSEEEEAAIDVKEAEMAAEAKKTGFEAALSSSDFAKATKLAAGDEAMLTAIEEKQDEDRKTWMSYYIDVGKFKDAHKLSVTEEEETFIKEAEKSAPEQARKDWHKYYIDTGDFKKAAGLAVTDEEVQAVADAAAATKKAKIEELKAKGDYKGAKKIADEEGIQLAEEMAMEKKRKEWMSYYTSIADYPNAIKMAVTPAEVAEVDAAFETKRSEHMKSLLAKQDYAAAKKFATTPEEIFMCDAYEEEDQELARKEWQRFYIEEGNFKEAFALCVDDSEELMVESAKTAFYSKCREEWLKHYTLKGDYNKALELVVSLEEQTALEAAMEKRRVEHFEYYLKKGKKKEAKKLAVTDAEVAKCA